MKTSALVASALFFGSTMANPAFNRRFQFAQMEIDGTMPDHNPKPEHINITIANTSNKIINHIPSSYRQFQHSIHTSGVHLNLDQKLSTEQMTQLGQFRVKKIFDQLKSAPVDSSGKIILDEKAYKPLILYYTENQDELWEKIQTESLTMKGGESPFSAPSPILSTFSSDDDELMGAAAGCWIRDPPKKSPVAAFMDKWPVSVITGLFSSDDDTEQLPSDIITTGTLITAPVVDANVGYETRLMLLAAKMDQEWSRNVAARRMVQEFQSLDQILSDFDNDTFIGNLLENGSDVDEETWFWSQEGSTQFENHGRVKRINVHVVNPGHGVSDTAAVGLEHQQGGEANQGTGGQSFARVTMTTAIKTGTTIAPTNTALNLKAQIDRIKQLLENGGKK